MSWKHTLELFDIMDDIHVDGESIRNYLRAIDPEADVTVERVEGPRGTTDFVRVLIPGTDGKTAGGTAPTLGVIGRLGGIGARPEVRGFVSDGDGALAAMAVAAKLSDRRLKGDALKGDVIVATHICPDAPTREHKPVPFMDSPVEILTMNQYEVEEQMDAVLSIDTTKGNRIVNHRGYAVTPTIKEGYILRISEDLLDAYIQTAGRLPVTLPITMQDITPYGNDIYHVNSIVQPCVATTAPVVGVAITTETAVAGCASNASHPEDIEDVVRFTMEVADRFGRGALSFYDTEEFARIEMLYGKMNHLQTSGGTNHE